MSIRSLFGSRGAAAYLPLGAVLLMLGCGPGPESHGAAWADYEGELPDSGGPEVLVQHIEVSVAGPGGRAFSVALRSPEMKQFPCASCHEDGRGRPVRLPTSQDREAHANIQATHPNATGAQCLSCHNADDMETLSLENGETVALDQAYQLCAQCHFQAVDDWVGGAHGKQVGGWLGDRVVASCASCHNPHAPAIGTRIPLLGPTIPRTGGRR